MRDNTSVAGRLRIFKNDTLITEVDNLVVDTGFAFLASRAVGAAATVMSHMAVGSNATAAAAGDIALGAEEGRVALSSAAASGDEVTYTATFPAGTATAVLREAGIFNAGSGGTMLNRAVFDAISKGASDSVTIQWTLTFAA